MSFVNFVTRVTEVARRVDKVVLNGEYVEVSPAVSAGVTAGEVAGVFFLASTLAYLYRKGRFVRSLKGEVVIFEDGEMGQVQDWSWTLKPIVSGKRKNLTRNLAWTSKEGSHLHIRCDLVVQEALLAQFKASPAPEPETEPATIPWMARSLGPETVVAPDPAPEPEPETVVAPEPAPEPEPETVVAPEPAPEPEPETVVAPEPAPEPKLSPLEARHRAEEEFVATVNAAHALGLGVEPQVEWLADAFLALACARDEVSPPEAFAALNRARGEALKAVKGLGAISIPEVEEALNLYLAAAKAAKEAKEAKASSAA